MSQAQSMLGQAVERDPKFSAALALLAQTHGVDYVNQWSDSPERSLKLQHELAEKAVSADESEPHAHMALGVAYLWERQHERAMVEGETAVGLEPNFSMGHLLLGWTHHYLGQQEEAIEFFYKTMRFDPHYPDVYLHFLAQAYFQMGRYAQAAETLRRRLTRNPESDYQSRAVSCDLWTSRRDRGDSGRVVRGVAPKPRIFFESQAQSAPLQGSSRFRTGR